jgi:hypothetical protein
LTTSLGEATTVFKEERMEMTSSPKSTLDELDDVARGRFDRCEEARKSFNGGSLKRRIRFSPHLEHVRATISRTDMTGQEVQECWWTPSEQDHLTSRARKLAEYTMHQGQSFVAKTIDRSFEKALNLALRSNMNVDRIFKLGSSENMRSQSLCMWAIHCNARRGLEKYCTRDQKRMVVIEQHQEDVLSAVNCGAMDEEIALVSIRSSAASAVYARMLGEADSYFVSNFSESPEDPTDKQKPLQ